MTRAMSQAEIYAFMGSGSKTGKLATVRQDGSPHIAAIWFDFDTNGDLMFLTGEHTVKAGNLRRDPRASVLVDTEDMPFDFARIDGTITFDDDPHQLLYWATETCRRYVGDARAEEFGRRNGVPGEVIARLTPTHMAGHLGVAD